MIAGPPENDDSTIETCGAMNFMLVAAGCANWSNSDGFFIPENGVEQKTFGPAESSAVFKDDGGAALSMECHDVVVVGAAAAAARTELGNSASRASVEPASKGMGVAYTVKA